MYMYHMGRGDEKMCFCSNRSRTPIAMVAYGSHKDLYITFGPLRSAEIFREIRKHYRFRFIYSKQF